MYTSRNFKAIALAVALFTFASFAAAATAQFTTIDYPGAVRTYALGNNPAGDIVGSYVDLNNEGHAFLLRNGVFTSFDYPNALWTDAYGINPRGDIVGQYGWFDGVNYIVRGFLFRYGQFIPIDISGHQNTMPFKISPKGTIVGCIHDNDAFGYTNLDAMYGFDLSVKGAVDTTLVRSMNTGINPDGDTVGYYFGTPTGTTLPRAGWSYAIREGVMSWFQYPNAFATLATDISANGTIVGRYRLASPTTFHGFILFEGQFESFDFPGAALTAPMGVNANGEIVGYYAAVSGTQVSYHGFLLQR